MFFLILNMWNPSEGATLRLERGARHVVVDSPRPNNLFYVRTSYTTLLSRCCTIGSLPFVFLLFLLPVVLCSHPICDDLISSGSALALCRLLVAGLFWRSTCCLLLSEFCLRSVSGPISYSTVDSDLLITFLCFRFWLLSGYRDCLDGGGSIFFRGCGFPCALSMAWCIGMKWSTRYHWLACLCGPEHRPNLILSDDTYTW